MQIVITEVSENQELFQQSTEKVLDSLDFCFEKFSRQLFSSALVRFGNSFQFKRLMEIHPQLLSLHLSWLCKILFELPSFTGSLFLPNPALKLSITDP